MKRVDPSIAVMLLVLSTALGRASAQDRDAVSGVVRDLHGIPQLGALVELLGPGSSVLAHTYTDDRGRYLLSAPEPGRYQLRTSAAFLLPVLRRNLRIGMGGRTLADVTMSAFFEMGDWFPVEARSKSEPTDDWRWTLRSSAERPLLRLASSTQDLASGSAEGIQPVMPDDFCTQEPISETPPSGQHQQLRIMSGSSGTLEDGVRQSWRAEREIAGRGIASLQGAIGVLSDGEGTPAIVMSTGYQEQNSSTHSRYRVMAGFISLPEVLGAGGAGYQSATFATGERLLLGDLVTIDAGTLLSAERLVSSRVSTAPFLRLLVHPSSDLTLMYRYAASRDLQSLDDFDTDSGVASPLSDAAGRPIGRQASHQEIAISRSTERNVATLALYRDGFSTGALRGGGNLGRDSFADLPVLSNKNSGEFAIAVRGYTAHGVSASWTHHFMSDLQATLEAEYGTALTVPESKATEVESLPDTVITSNQPALTATIVREVPRTATTFEVRYHWQPTKTLTIINSFDAATDEAYAGVLLKQRLWRGRRLRSVSAIVEASNLLEEGYQPVMGPDGETLFLAQVPRTVQAGLAFSF